MFDKFSNNIYKEQKILKFELSKGGDQSGRSENTVIVAIDPASAILRHSLTEGIGQEEKVTERTVDIQPLVDIKEIFLKHEMYRWTNRPFTFTFSVDRPTLCYTFTFERGTVQFSSQSFPAPYADKIAELDAVVAGVCADILDR